MEQKLSQELSKKAKAQAIELQQMTSKAIADTKKFEEAQKM